MHISKENNGVSYEMSNKLGASIPLRQLCISPVFEFPPISEEFFEHGGKFSNFDLFLQKCSIFIRQNF